MGISRKVDETDIQQLRQLLSHTDAAVYAPSDDGYAATIERCSRAAEKPAGVSIVPKTAQDVSIAVKFASSSGLDVAVKAGGHSTAGSSSTDGGLLIDLGKMRNVRVEPAQALVYVEGGALWQDVDQAAWKHGLATVGGTVADTGVGGLTLGGGYGHLSGKYGLAIDNLVGATVVVANGEIKTANKTENPDLFWALRGAGQNFGVTTEFVFQAYPQGDVYAGTLIFPPSPDAIQKITQAANELYQVRDTPQGPRTNVDGRAASMIALAKPPQAGGQTVILIICAFDGSEEEGKKIFQPFVDAGPFQNTLAMMPYPKLNTQVPVIPGFRSSMKGAAFVLPLKPDFIMNILGQFEQFVGQNPDAAMTLVTWELYDTVKVTALDNGSFANRGYHMNGLVMPMWSSEKNDKVCRQWARDVSNLYKAELEAHGEVAGNGVNGGVGRRGHKGAVMLYGNYDQYDEISKDIFGENYEKLQEVKAKYDPTNVFNKLFAITPLSA